MIDLTSPQRRKHGTLVPAFDTRRSCLDRDERVGSLNLQAAVMLLRGFNDDIAAFELDGHAANVPLTRIPSVHASRRRTVGQRRRVRVLRCAYAFAFFSCSPDASCVSGRKLHKLGIRTFDRRGKCGPERSRRSYVKSPQDRGRGPSPRQRSNEDLQCSTGSRPHAACSLGTARRLEDISRRLAAVELSGLQLRRQGMPHWSDLPEAAFGPSKGSVRYAGMSD